MPGQAKRKKSVRLKLNTIKPEFAGRNVLLVDDSIVRGTTANEIIQMAREAGARKVFFSSAAPPIRFPNIYGIDIPTRQELVAYEREEKEIAAKLGCDWVVYQDLTDLEDSISKSAPIDRPLTQFDTSCFSGTYVTGERIGDEYFNRLYNLRNDDAKQKRENVAETPSKQKPQQSNEGCESIPNGRLF
jgi:amidophosphoribosyltransferase